MLERRLLSTALGLALIACDDGGGNAAQWTPRPPLTGWGGRPGPALARVLLSSIAVSVASSKLVRPRVRDATAHDVAALARIHVDSWHQAYAGIIAPHNLAQTSYSRSVTRFGAYFRQGGQRRSLLHVLDTDAGVFGYVNSGRSTSPELGARGEVFELYLHPEAQGLGGGRKLFSAAIWALAEHRATPVVVWALTDNHRARRFYEAMRGREVARGETTVGDQLLDKVAYLWRDYLPWPEWL